MPRRQIERHGVFARAGRTIASLAGRDGPAGSRAARVALEDGATLADRRRRRVGRPRGVQLPPRPRSAIRPAVAAGADSAGAIGPATRAGTGCGSCGPQLARLLAARA